MEPNVGTVKFHPSAEAELVVIRAQDIKLCHEIVTRCLQLRVNPHPTKAEVISCHKKGYEINKLKRASFPAYRVLYALDEVHNFILILGIMPRSVNYEGVYMDRIIDDYIAHFGGGSHVSR